MIPESMNSRVSMILYCKESTQKIWGRVEYQFQLRILIANDCIFYRARFHTCQRKRRGVNPALQKGSPIFVFRENRGSSFSVQGLYPCAPLIKLVAGLESRLTVLNILISPHLQHDHLIFLSGWISQILSSSAERENVPLPIPADRVK